MMHSVQNLPVDSVLKSDALITNTEIITATYLELASSFQPVGYIQTIRATVPVSTTS